MIRHEHDGEFPQIMFNIKEQAFTTPHAWLPWAIRNYMGVNRYMTSHDQLIF